MPDITIAKLEAGGAAVQDYARLRAEMWDIQADENDHEVAELLTDSDHWAVFVAFADGLTVGFLEVRLRACADGAESTPVGYLEGWFIQPEYRAQGAGRKLVEAGEAWAASRGCVEMGSDASIDNPISIRAHVELGYSEVDRVVRFVKKL